MHPRTEKVPHDGPPIALVSRDAKNYQDTPRHILAEKITSPPSDHHDRYFIFVTFHVYSNPVPDVAFYEDLPPPHSVPTYISRPAMDDNLSSIHRIPNVILGILFHDNVGTVHECAKVVSRNSFNNYGHVFIYSISDVILPVHIFQNYLAVALTDGIANHLVQISEVNSLRINFQFHRCHTSMHYSFPQLDDNRFPGLWSPHPLRIWTNLSNCCLLAGHVNKIPLYSGYEWSEFYPVI